jgi:hypothetical protein
VGFEVLAVGLVQVQVLVSLFVMCVSSWTIWILMMEAASSRQNGNYLAVNRARFPEDWRHQGGKDLRDLSNKME